MVMASLARVYKNRNTPPPDASGNGVADSEVEWAFDALVAALHRIEYFKHCGMTGCPYTWDRPTALGIKCGEVAAVRRVIGYLVHYYSDAVVAAIRRMDKGRVCLPNYNDTRFADGLMSLLPARYHGDVRTALAPQVDASPQRREAMVRAGGVLGERRRPSATVSPAIRIMSLTRIVDAFEALARTLPTPETPALDHHRVRLGIITAKYDLRREGSLSPSMGSLGSSLGSYSCASGGSDDSPRNLPMTTLLGADLSPLEHYVGDDGNDAGGEVDMPC